MLGKLTWAAIPFDQPIALITGLVVVVVIFAVLALVTIKGWWPYLWREWITSVDHKRIGGMYFALALVMLLRGFADAIMMRTQQAIPVGDAQGYLPPDYYDQIFSAHGTIMIFFVAMPLVIGLMNFVVPLQLGVRDVAFPVLNSVSFWLTATGALLINLSLVIGNFARTGWMGYPPLSELAYSPDVGVDYYLWSLQISGIGTLLTGINFVTTILKLRAPGMIYFPMPVFCWTALAANLLIVAAFPILTATFVMLLLDRYLGMHFFTNDLGGNQMMYAICSGRGAIRKSTFSFCRRSASFPKWPRPFPARGCSATARWCGRPWGSASSRLWSGCITSSQWERAPTSTRSLGSCRRSSRCRQASRSSTGCSRCSAAASCSKRRPCGWLASWFRAASGAGPASVGW